MHYIEYAKSPKYVVLQLSNGCITVSVKFVAVSFIKYALRVSNTCYGSCLYSLLVENYMLSILPESVTPWTYSKVQSNSAIWSYLHKNGQSDISAYNKCSCSSSSGVGANPDSDTFFMPRILKDEFVTFFIMSLHRYSPAVCEISILLNLGLYLPDVASKSNTILVPAIDKSWSD